jgi:hypothetical protein
MNTRLPAPGSPAGCLRGGRIKLSFPNSDWFKKTGSGHSVTRDAASALKSTLVKGLQTTVIMEEVMEEVERDPAASSA